MGIGATAKRTISVIIAGDASSLHKTFGEVQGFGSELTSKVGGNAKAIGNKLTGIGLAATGVGMAFVGLAKPAEEAHHSLEAAVKASGHNMEDYEGAIDHADARMENFAHTHADTESALAKLTAAYQDPKKALDALALTANVAGFKHISLASAAALVVKMHAGAGKVFKEFGLSVKDAGASEKELTAAQKANASTAARLAKARETQAKFEVQLHLKKKLTANDYLREVELQRKTSSALGDYTAAHRRLEKAQTGVHSKQADIDKAMADLGKRVKGQASAAVEGFAGKLEIWKTKATDFAAKWGEKLGPILVTAGPLMSGLGLIISSEVVPAFFAWAGSALAAAAPFLLVVAIVALLVGGFVLAYTKVKWFHKAVDAIGRFFRDTLWPILKKVGSVIKDVFGKAVQWAIDLFYRWPRAIVRALVSFGVTVWGALSKAFAFLRKMITAGVNLWLAIYVRFPIRVAHALVNFGKTVWGGITRGLTWVRDRIGDAVNLWLDVYVRFPMRVVGAIGNLGLTIWHGVASGFDSFKSSVSNVLGSIVAFFVDLPSRIIRGLGNIGSALLGIGRGLIQGIADGIRGAWHLIWDGLKDAIGKIPGLGALAGILHHVPGVSQVMSALGFAEGGIVNFPKTGKLAMLHGREAILPLDNPRRTGEVLARAGLLSKTRGHALSLPAHRAGGAAAVEAHAHFHLSPPPGADARWLRWLSDELARQMRDGGPLGLALRDAIKRAQHA